MWKPTQATLSSLDNSLDMFCFCFPLVPFVGIPTLALERVMSWEQVRPEAPLGLTGWLACFYSHMAKGTLIQLSVCNCNRQPAHCLRHSLRDRWFQTTLEAPGRDAVLIACSLDQRENRREWKCWQQKALRGGWPQGSRDHLEEVSERINVPLPCLPHEFG